MLMLNHPVVKAVAATGSIFLLINQLHGLVVALNLDLGAKIFPLVTSVHFSQNNNHIHSVSLARVIVGGDGKAIIQIQIP